MYKYTYFSTLTYANPQHIIILVVISIPILVWPYLCPHSTHDLTAHTQGVP